MEGILERSTEDSNLKLRSSAGVLDNLLAGDTFGQEALIEDKHINKLSIKCKQRTKMLQIKKEHFNRYVRAMQLEEWGRVAKLFSELPVFNEPDSAWEGPKLERLLESIHLKTYQAGDIIFREGGNQSSIIFLLSGHVRITKVVEDEKLKRMNGDNFIASPLHSTIQLKMAMNKDNITGETSREIDICTLYRGAILDAEAALSLMPASFTAIAMSHVEVGMIDTTTSILIDVPVSHFVITS